jgi:hypothetical protein
LFHSKIAQQPASDQIPCFCQRLNAHRILTSSVGRCRLFAIANAVGDKKLNRPIERIYPIEQAKAAQEHMRADQHFVFRRPKCFSEAHAQYWSQPLTLEPVQSSRSCPAMASTASVREMGEFSLPNADLSLAGDCPSRMNRGRL